MEGFCGVGKSRQKRWHAEGMARREAEGADGWHAEGMTRRGEENAEINFYVEGVRDEIKKLKNNYSEQ